MVFTSRTSPWATFWVGNTGDQTGLFAGSYAGVTLNSSSVIVRPEVAARQLAEVGVAVNLMSLTLAPLLTTGRPRRVQAGQPILPWSVASTAQRRSTQFARGVTCLRSRTRSFSISLPFLTPPLKSRSRSRADLPEGAPDKVVRTVTENALTLKFKSHGFEKG